MNKSCETSPSAQTAVKKQIDATANDSTADSALNQSLRGAIKTELKVRGYHLDMYRHVNNARYLEFLEEGRWAFFDQNPHFEGWPRGISFFVVNININFRRPASFGDILEIRTTISHLGNKSGVMHQEIVKKETASIVADAAVTFVIVDSKTQKALPLEGDLRTCLEKLTDL